MTFFLPKEGTLPAIQAPPSSGGVPSFAQGVAAATTATALETDRNFRFYRDMRAEAALRARAALDLMDTEAVDAEIARRGIYTGGMLARELVGSNPKATAVVLEMAQEAAEGDAEAWAEINLDEEHIYQTVIERQRADYAAAQDILSAMPEGQGLAGFIGAVAATASDMKSVPFYFIGGPNGSLMRTFGRGAAVNMAAEGVFLPSQFAQAERLQIPDPNVVQQLAFAGAVGGTLDAGAEALGRAFTYWRSRDAVIPQVAGMERAEVADTIDRIEDELHAGGPDLEDRVQAILDTTRRAPQPPPGRPPLVLRPEDRVSAAPPPVETTLLPPLPETIPAPDDVTLREVAEGAIARAEEPDLPEWAERMADELEEQAAAVERAATRGRRYPLLTTLRRMGVRIDPTSPEGQELYAILGGAREANRTMPGLFRRGGNPNRANGSTGLDNIVADEMEDDYPGISVAAGVDNGYLTRDGVYDLIRREAAGDWSWMTQMQDARLLRSYADDARRAGRTTAGEDFVARGVAEQNSFVVDLDLYYFDQPNTFAVNEQIARDVTEFLERRGYWQYLDPAERDEFIRTMQETGGDAELLAERFMERERDYAALPPQEAVDEWIPFGDDDTAPPGAVGQREQAGGGPDADAIAAGGGGARAGDAADFERTAAGDQAVIPGVAPVSERQRLEARQAAPLRGGDRPMDAGLFDTGARAQRDMFADRYDVPTNPKAVEEVDGQINDLRAAIEADPEMGDAPAGFMDADGKWDGPVTEDGAPLRTMREVLDYEAEQDAAIARLMLCGRGNIG